MFTLLGEERLKTGERLDVGVVRAPDGAWAERIGPFLGHKNDAYRAHIRRALEGPLDALQTRYYVGCVAGRLISQVQIVGERGAGILGHVYTLPEERRKGACAAIFRHLMADVAGAGFRVLGLGTGFETPPYWIYHSFGFRPVAAGRGWMKWEAEPGAEAALLSGQCWSVRELRWDDWGWMEILGLQPAGTGEELPRSAVMGLKAQGSLEGPFVEFQVRRERNARIQGRALVAGSGATAGWAILAPEPRCFGDGWLADVWAHPGFEGALPELVAGLAFPEEAPTVAWLTEPEGPRAAALRGAGFRPAARLPEWLEHAGERRDLVAWRRNP